MSTPHSLADCCPRCDPYAGACLPVVTPTEEPDHPGSLCAFYRCPDGHTWTCWWDAEAAEWPTPRRAA